MAERDFKFNIQFKFFIILISIIVFICSILVGFFVTWTKVALYRELEKRGEVEAKSLAYDAKYGVLTEDAVILDHLVDGRMSKPDITCIVITNYDGVELASGIKDGYVFCSNISEKTSTINFDKDVRRTEARSENSQRNYIFTALIMTERIETPEKKEIADNILFFAGETTEKPPIIRGTVNVGISLVHIDNIVLDTLSVSVLITFLIVVISIAISSRFIRIVTDPIREVTRVANEIAGGDLTKTVDVCTSDEIGIMAENFNKMTSKLRNTIEELVDLKGSLEIKVDERTVELENVIKIKSDLLKEVESANKELQNFAFIVSHDLKAPLRAINSLVLWILEDYKDKFDEEGKQQMRLLNNRVKRMYNLIDGILEYSRAGLTKMQIDRVDLNALLREIIDTLNPPDNINIKVKDEMPPVFYGTVHMGQVFQNLLSNAIKFIDKPRGEIIIGCVDADDYWQFSVADNGPGIDAKHFESIFNISQTLSPKDDLENTGIGLTITKKIVEIYSGTIKVESEMGYGSVFYFTVPKKMEITQ